jgi:hypothetical protein
MSKKALLVGIDEYGTDISPRRGCEHARRRVSIRNGYIFNYRSTAL